MSNIFFTRLMPDGFYAVSNGTGEQLDKCPCCAKPFTARAAEALIANLRESKYTWAQLRLMATMSALEAKEPR